jgi:hypothetical protein
MLQKRIGWHAKMRGRRLMTTKYVMAILLAKRKETAVNVQKILTGWGCMIKTRLGIHDGVLDDCADTGLIILELVGEPDKMREFRRKLELISGVKAQLVELSLAK